jgi:integrase/recombinase XerC
MAMSRSAAKSWAGHVDEFIAHLASEERSDHTIRNYQDDVKAFGAWYQTQYGEPPELGAVAKIDLVRWKEHIDLWGGRKGSRAAPATTNRKLAAMRKLIAWAKEQGLNPGFTPPKPVKVQVQPEPRSLTWDERTALIHAVEEFGTPQHQLIIRLGIDAGLRVHEMAGLLGSDLTLSERKSTMTIRGKRGKQRTVPMTQVLRKAFFAHGYQRYIGQKVHILRGPRGPLTIRGLQWIAEKFAGLAPVTKKQRGIPDFSIHCLRHTAAYWMLNHPKKEQRFTLQETAHILGHSDINVTRLYVTPHEEEIGEWMAQRDD